jgi:hypothetical protein
MTFCLGPVLGGFRKSYVKERQNGEEGGEDVECQHLLYRQEGDKYGGYWRGQYVRESLHRLIHPGHSGQMLFWNEHGRRCLAGGKVERGEA